MRLIVGALTAILILAACTGAPGPIVDGASSPEELVEFLRRAIESGDRDAVMALHHWEGVSEKARETKRRVIERFYAAPIESLELQPLTTFNYDFELGGVPHRMNVDLRGNILLRYTEAINGSLGFSFGYGVVGDRFYLPVAVPMDAPEESP